MVLQLCISEDFIVLWASRICINEPIDEDLCAGHMFDKEQKSRIIGLRLFYRI